MITVRTKWDKLYHQPGFLKPHSLLIMPPKTVAIIGGLDVDLVMITNRIPDRGESVLADEYVEVMGGKGANSAIATYRACHIEAAKAWDLNAAEDVAKTDVHVRMIGAVGDDIYGEKITAKLRNNGIDTKGIVTVPNTRSSICFVMIEGQTRENRCLFTHGATATWTKEHFVKPEDLGSGIRPDLVVAQMEIAKDVVETMIETAGKARIDFCLNAAPASPIGEHLYQYLTHLLVNESEAAIMSGRPREDVNEDTWPTVAQEFLRRGAKNVVITLGSQGAFYATSTESGHCHAHKVEVIDTTGAG